MSTATIAAEIVLYSASEGGRKAPVVASPRYRPHLVVGDRNQREPLADGHPVAEDYLGVAFSGDGEALVAGVAHTVELTLLYPEVDYGNLVEGATFTVREGPAIIGHGVVLARD